jgi:hypothetical protein
VLSGPFPKDPSAPLRRLHSFNRTYSGLGVQALSRNHLIFGQYLNLHFNTPFALSLTGPENS